MLTYVIKRRDDNNSYDFQFHIKQPRKIQSPIMILKKKLLILRKLLLKQDNNVVSILSTIYLQLSFDFYHFPSNFNLLLLSLSTSLPFPMSPFFISLIRVRHSKIKILVLLHCDICCAIS